MKRICLISELTLALSTAYSQPECEVSISMPGEKDTIFVFDPFKVKIAIKDGTSNAIKTLPISADRGQINRAGSIGIEFRCPEDSVWRPTRQLLNSHDEQGLTIYPHDYSIELKPGQIHAVSYDPPPALLLKVLPRGCYFYMGAIERLGFPNFSRCA